MTLDNPTLAEVADVLDAWAEFEERRLPYLDGVDKAHARNCAVNFAWLRDQIRNRIQEQRCSSVIFKSDILWRKHQE